MKKNMRTLLIMLAVLVVLGGGAAVLLLTQPQPAEDTSSSSSSTVTETVVEKNANDITSISVENPTDSFTLVPVVEDTVSSASSEESETSGEESSQSSSSAKFTLQGYEQFDLNSASISTSGQSVANITASKNLGQQEDLESFGLAGENATTITVNYNDGSTDELVVGNQAGESVGRYLLKDGVVYITSSVSSGLLGSPLDYINTDLYSVPDRVEETVDSEGESTQTTAADILYHSEFSGTHLGQTVIIDYDESKASSYMMVEPVYAESGTDDFQNIITALKSLTADSVVAAGRTQENLEAYGLAEPYAQVTFDMNGEEHTLAVSAAGTDGRYLTFDDVDLIYQVADDTVSTWAEANLMDLRMGYVWLANINEVEHLDLAVEGGVSYRYDVTRIVNEEKSTEEKTSYDLSVVNASGETIDYENYQAFYQNLLSISVLTVEDVVYDESSPALQVTYEYFDSEPDVIAYCPVEGQDERYAAILNGEFSGLVRKSEVQNIISQMQLLDTNQPVE